MGIFNRFGEDGLELKVGNLGMFHFNVGDFVPDVKDGVYLAYGGVVVILNSKLAAIFNDVKTKWGHSLSPSSIIDDHNPLKQVVDAIVKAKDEIRRRNKVKKKVPKFRLLKRKTISDR